MMGADGLLHVTEGTMSATYDREVDVLHIGIGDPTPSYSIGNPADVPRVEWMVAVAEPERITGAIVMDWAKVWGDQVPPLPFALTRNVIERGMHGKGAPPDPLAVMLHRLRSHISIDPGVLGGKPRVTGTRVGVTHVVAAAIAGGPGELRAQFPNFTEDDIMACQLFARLVLERPGIGAALLDKNEGGDDA